MATTETVYADLCSRTYNGTANRYPNSSGTESPAATHGYYGSNGNWVGMVRLPINLSGKVITAITLTMTANTAGTTSSKTVYIYSSNYQTSSASGRGSIFPNAQLGSISGRFRNATTEVDLSSSLLSNVAEYLAQGNQMLILYDPTGSESNYCRFTSIIAEITYEDQSPIVPDPEPDPEPEDPVVPYRTVKIMYRGAWVECKVHYKYKGAYVLCNPHYHYDGRYIDCDGS